MFPRYPIYIPSKGRWQDARALTVKALARDAVPFRLVVEPSEAEHYASWITARDQLLVLPRDDFTLLKARNWIRDHAEAEGATHHWQIDDNILRFTRFWEGTRIPCHAGAALRVCEDFAGRFTNIGVAGLNYEMFIVVGAGGSRVPYFRNTHVYSCTLINHAMPYRWRLVYNDDTDLCLQALTNEWGTITLNAFSVCKQATMDVRGGNTDDLYRADDDVADTTDTYGRYRMARVLERAWPGLVTIGRRFDRFQHEINWKAFRGVAWRSNGVDVAALPEVDEYGLTLRFEREPRSKAIRALGDAYAQTLAEIGAPEPLWRGLPAFRAPEEPVKLVIECATVEAREELATQLAVTVDKRYKNKAWSAWWPPRERSDPAALRFDVKSERSKMRETEETPPNEVETDGGDPTEPDPHPDQIRPGEPTGG